jgi:hypothetical protein
MKKRLSLALVGVVAAVAAIVLGTSLATAGGGGSNTAASSSAQKISHVGPLVNSDNIFVLNTKYSAAVYSYSATGGTKLTVKTMDCCVAGDHWGITVIDDRAGADTSKDDVAKNNCGLGSTTTFAGSSASLGPPYTGTGKIVVYYCSGTELFAAQGTLRVQYDGSLTVTPQTSD